jgi:protein CpxP
MRLPPSRLALTAAAVFALSTGAAVAVAQDGPPPPPPMADDGPGGPPPMMGHPRFDPEVHAQHLRDLLQLRADQDGALKAYLDAAGPGRWDKDRPGRERGDAPRKPLTTPERLDREAEHLDRARARIEATRAFYAALSPSQKKAFDALGPMGGGPGPMMRRVEFRHAKGRPGDRPAVRPKAD